ncbi:MAG: hypothetical protein IH951_11690 [Bacteroidetes bacterium]|nr:hypothetical protein [Bacteroidota bacterium]
MKSFSHILVCPACGAFARLTIGTEVYGDKWAHVKVWVCRNFPECRTYVGCHPGTDTPLGTLADRKLRTWRKQAHSVFDHVWRSRKMTRKQAYYLLRKRLEIPKEEAHIAMMDVAGCQRVIDAFKFETGKETS